jgi:hypothetical protein
MVRRPARRVQSAIWSILPATRFAAAPMPLKPKALIRMRILLSLPAEAPARWHVALVERLAAEGAEIIIERRAPPAPPADLKLLEQMERLLVGRGRARLSDAAVGTAAIDRAPAPSPGEAYDLAIDLSGAAHAPKGAVVPLYDGAPGALARDYALLSGRTPRLSLARVGDDGEYVELASARPALERPWLLCDGRDAVAARLATLVAALARGETLAPALPDAAAPRRSGQPLLFFAAAVARVAARRLRRLLCHDDHWRIGWRRLAASDSVLDRLDWPERADWRWLPDDARRYFADPLIFERDGRRFVFCEEFLYGPQKGVVSVFEIDAAGKSDTPRIVLERPYHLSYPVVFEHDGDIWMMPESSANSTLELYRCVSFPDRWTLDRVLLRDVEIADATLLLHDGRWWLFGATSEPGTMSWDCLSIYTGPSPLGPWTPCGAAPALIDAACARPAGPFLRRGGELWRPAQMCIGGYGAGLALCRVDRLDETGFAQTVVRSLAPPRGAPSHGVHTLSIGAGYEFIDAAGPCFRYGPRRKERECSTDAVLSPAALL